MPNDLKKDERKFLGRGWRFPVAVNRLGEVATSAQEQNIRESIFIILGTAPGERLQRPTFGCDVHELVFAPNNLNTASRAARYCEEALQKWELRIDSVQAKAEACEGEANRLDIRIDYRVRATNQSGNLVYPFYLRTDT